VISDNLSIQLILQGQIVPVWRLAQEFRAYSDHETDFDINFFDWKTENFLTNDHKIEPLFRSFLDFKVGVSVPIDGTPEKGSELGHKLDVAQRGSQVLHYDDSGTRRFLLHDCDGV